MYYFNRCLFFFVSLLLLCLNQSAFAFNCYKDEAPPCLPEASCPPRKLLLDGFYVGGQLGYDAYWIRQNISTPDASDITGNPKINAPGWVYGALIGFGRYVYEPFYLGAEAFFNYSVANESYFLEDLVGHYSSKISARQSHGIAILPGIGVTDSLLIYLRLGYNWGAFAADETSIGVTTKKKNTVCGPNYGVGMEALLAEAWSIRAEYTHTNYSSFSTLFGSNYDPSNNQFMAALIYHFYGCSC